MKQAPRGFMLLIILIIGAAAMASAIVLISVGGSTQVLGAKAVGGDRARAAAWTGAERAFLHLEETLKVRRDFDTLLDPDGTCVPVGQPAYTDAATVSFAGASYASVPVDGAAYLTRFFDDADDLVADSPALQPFSNNTPGAGGGCNEGPAAGDNPARDRNRSIYVEVIGYFPGGDPGRATHRVRLVRHFVSIAPVGEGIVTVSGNLTVNSDVDFCAPVGDIGVGGNLDVSGVLGMCGRAAAGGTISAGGPVTPSPACEIPCGPQGGSVAGVPLTPAFPGVPDVFDAASPCNFYLRTAGSGLGGMWGWAPTLDYGGLSCGAYASPVIPLPTAAGTEPGSCWQPLLTVVGAALVDHTGGPPPGGAWTFRADLGGGTRPDWASECRGAGVGWPLPDGAADLGCTACDQGVTRFDLATDRWTVLSTATGGAPAGVYFHAGGVNPQLVFETPSGTGNRDVEADWAPMTIVAFGGLTTSGGTGRLSLGIGAPFPSLVVVGPLTIDGPLELTGNVFVGGNLVVNGAAHFYGRLHVDGNATFATPLTVDHYRSLLDPRTRPVVFPTPTTARSPL